MRAFIFACVIMSVIITIITIDTVYLNDKIDELYDLDADQGECRNLIRERYDSPALKALRADLYADLKAHGDPFIRHGWLDGQLLGERKHKPWRESQ